MITLAKSSRGSSEKRRYEGILPRLLRLSCPEKPHFLTTLSLCRKHKSRWKNLRLLAVFSVLSTLDKAFKGLIQGFRLYGLTKVGIESCLHTPLNVLIKGVCGKGYHRDSL